jgi:hypothetical protein
MPGSQSQRIRRGHEAATSINIAFVLVAFVMIGGANPIPIFLLDADRVISRRLGLLDPHVSFTLGYFAFFIPAIVCALCTWCFLRLSAATPFTREFLRSVAGIAAFIGPQAWWLCWSFSSGWNPTAEIPTFEVVVFVVGVWYLFKGRPVPGRSVLLVLLLHYGFWFWQYGRHLYFMGYGGPIGLTVGLCASLIWLLYRRQLALGR